jgi:hypothetical protein
LLTLALPAAAFGESRTWVSGVGDDANPCSRTAPCKTFAGAISKTEAGGEIDVLDSGGFGAVTITKSITISATGVTAGVLVSGTNGIVVSAPSTANVTLRGLDFDGIGSGLSGVMVSGAASVTIENSSIFGFLDDGVLFQPTNANAKLFVENSTIEDNLGDGILAASASGSNDKVLLRNDEIQNNACGIVATTLGVQAPTPNFALDCGTNASGTPAGSVQLSTINAAVTGNTGAGVLSNGSGANNTIASDVIVGNGTGLQKENSGTIQSLDNNELYGNTVEGSPTSIANPDVGPAGPQGPIGPQGPAGSVGATGAQGPAGANGAAGQIELVTCKTVTKTKTVKHKKHKVKTQQCSGKLVSGTVKLSAADAGAHATVSRAGHMYATGTATHSSRGTRLALTSRQPVKAGRYTLTLSQGGHTIGHETVVVS